MAAQATSIANLLYQISQADVNNQGLVAWEGTNGLQQITENLTASLGARGILYFNSTSQMALAGGSDSGYAVCNTDNGLAFYKFFPSIDTTITGAVTSSAAGQWRPIYAQTIENVARWTSITVSFTPTIGQASYVVNLVTPITTFYNVLVTPTNRAAGVLLWGAVPAAGYYIEGKTDTEFTLVFSTPSVAANPVEIEIAILY